MNELQDILQTFNTPFAGVDRQLGGDLRDLAKALSTGHTYTPSTQVGGGALRLESLDATLKTLTFEERAAVMWQMIPKVKAWSTVEEYTQEHEVGDAQFYVEGGSPEVQDTVYSRELELVKYLGNIGKIHNPALAVRNLINLKARETRNRTRGIIRKQNKTIYFGDSSVNPLEYNGILRHVSQRADNPTQNIIDMAGKRMSLEKINEGATIIRDNYGIPDRIFMSLEGKQGYQDHLIANKRFFVGSDTSNVVGINPNKWRTANGEGDVFTDVFLRTNDSTSPMKAQNKTWIKKPGQPPVSATSAKAPGTPTLGSVTTPASSDSKFASGDAGTYDYKITAKNAYGESAAVAETGVVVAAGDKVIIPVTEAGGAFTATGYCIYRRLDGEDLYKYCFSVAVSGASQNVEDYNEWRHGCTTSFMLDMSLNQVLSYHQLLPMIAMPLAIIDDSIRWLMKLYGVLMVYNPNKIVVYKNVGLTAWT
jgi:hypothetical protein